MIDIEKALDYFLSCQNFDGGFGCRPGSESHSGQVTMCLCSVAQVAHLREENQYCDYIVIQEVGSLNLVSF